MQTLVRSRNTDESPTFTTSRPIASRPVTSAGTIGVPVRGFARPSTPENGSARSRDIENIIRIDAVWIASVQTQTAIATSASSTFATGSDSWLVRTYGSPIVPRSGDV